MDNAAKALTMAAEILIAILIITLAVYAFVYYKDVAVTYEKAQIEQEAQKFNTQFTKYLGKEVTAQEIVTLVHIANAKDDQDVEICVESVEMTDQSDTDLIEFVKNNTSTGDGVTMPIKIKKFKCANVKYNDENKVCKVEFENV